MRSEYKICVKTNLNVLRNQRYKLCNLTIMKNPKVYCGLREKSASTRKVYYQLVIVEWLDEHWEELDKVLNEKKNITNEDKKATIKLFAKEFLKFFENDYRYMGVLQEENIKEMLKVWKENMDQLIDVADNCDYNMWELKAMRKKHEEQFRDMLKM